MAERAPGDADVTTLLAAWSNGDPQALERLAPIVYRHLRARAAALFHRESPGHLLQPTALVHEAYLRLVDQQSPRFQNREHFFALAARLMRRVLVDEARERKAGKRGGGVPALSLDEARDRVSSPDQPDRVALAEALDALARLDERQARIATYRFFVGLTVDETAALLRISAPTVKRECRVARAWLHRCLVGP